MHPVFIHYCKFYQKTLQGYESVFPLTIMNHRLIFLFLMKDSKLLLWILRAVHNCYAHFSFLNFNMVRMMRPFQQDGATSHPAKTEQSLSPFHSPDLSTCDFFLLCYLKSKVYQKWPHTAVKQLKARIQLEIDRIPPCVLYDLMNNSRK